MNDKPRTNHMNRIFTEGKSFVDDKGRQRIFNGINLCDKGMYDGIKLHYNLPWSKHELEELKNCGMNVIRLGFTWDAVEPAPGKYDEDFLNRLGTMLDWCAENKIYAYLDMHQDLYSGFGKGCGDGAPEWACLSDGYSYRREIFVWAEGYFINKAVHRCFDNFWDNKQVNGKGLQDYYADMWAHVAERFCEHPALLGFDLMNEPFPGKDGGSVFRKIAANLITKVLSDKNIKKTRMLKGVLKADSRHLIFEPLTVDVFEYIVKKVTAPINKFDKERFSPFINKVTAAIREKTDNGIIFFENCYYSNLGVPCETDAIEFDGKREPNQVFSPHAYDLMVDTPLYKYADNNRVGAIFAQRKKEQDERLKMPVLVGEWGGNSIGTHWLPHVEYLLDLFDKNQWSNTYWAYVRDTLKSPVMTVLCRPYPQAVTGEIVSYRHDRDANTFTLVYKQDREYDAATEIYAHKKVESVETDGEVSFEDINGEASVIIVKTVPGEHTVKVKFAGEGFSYESIRGEI